MGGVVIKNLFKSFGEKKAEKKVLEGIDLEIKDKEFCVLVGPSGCGKSTLLRIIAGLEEQTSGEVWINKKLMNNVAPKDRDIAFVFQSYALYPHLNVYDNIAFSLKIKNTEREKIKERVQTAAQMLGLEDLLKRKPKELSGGQRQRVALGRAIVREPQIFLMDEPLSNLDAKLRVSMRSEIKKLVHTLDTTCIYVTHDQVEALTMGDKIVVLNDGKIQQVDSAQNIYNNPKNTFVATFMGSMPMNIVEFESANFALRGMFEGARAKVLVGFRAEDVKIANWSEDYFKFSACVDFVESLGSEKIVYFELNGAKCSAKLPVDAAIAAIGEVSDFYVSTNKLHFFDVETKVSLSGQ